MVRLNIIFFIISETEMQTPDRFPQAIQDSVSTPLLIETSICTGCVCICVNINVTFVLVGRVGGGEVQ